MGNNFQTNEKVHYEMHERYTKVAFRASFKQKLSDYQKSVKWIIKKSPTTLCSFQVNICQYLILYIFDKSVIALDLISWKKLNISELFTR